MNKEKLPKEFKKQWVEALLSGKYKQGNGTLYSAWLNEYCCLGVACDVAGISKSKFKNGSVINFLTDPDYKVPELIRGSGENPIVAVLAGELNDEGVPFEVIAGVINEYL